VRHLLTLAAGCSRADRPDMPPLIVGRLPGAYAGARSPVSGRSHGRARREADMFQERGKFLTIMLIFGTLQCIGIARAFTGPLLFDPTHPAFGPDWLLRNAAIHLLVGGLSMFGLWHMKK